ncbi:type I-E CRISPR-associated protein Cse2/CasB [Caballeronia sp. LZ016]|uniref:type I-E CRISPR-associated protein Cse2/CasB n=1 Tax=Caballeronia sp. LZ016 TaxID=3038554 RepID=UPI003857458A
MKASKNDYVALKRLDPDAQTLATAQIAALMNVAARARLDCAKWTPDEWRRWAFIAYGIALAGHDRADNTRSTLGRQLHLAGVSEARVTRLLDARGAAFFELLRRMLRLMNSRNVAPSWNQLGRLVLYEGAREGKRQDIAEKMRLDIAYGFFSANANASASREQ